MAYLATLLIGILSSKHSVDMGKNPIVCNTSPITNLVAIAQLDLLRQLYGEIVISPLSDTIYLD